MPNTATRWIENTITVNTNSAGTQRNPRIIQLDNGDILVAWETDDPVGQGAPAGFDIMAQRFDQGGNKVGEEFRIHTVAGDNEGDFSLANVTGGQFLVVYEDVDVVTTSLRLDRVNETGTALTDPGTLVASDTVAAFPNFQNPEIAVSSATEALIIYEETDATGGQVFFNTYNPTTDALGVQTLLLDGTNVTDPSIASLSNGNFVVTATFVSADQGIGMRIVDSTGANILSTTNVAGTNVNGDTDSGARVEALTGGGFVVAWENDDGTDRDIEFQIFDSAGTAVSAVLTMAEPGVDNNENYTELSITPLSDGGFVIMGDNNTPGELNLILQRYDASGNTVGNIIGRQDSNESQIDITLLADGRMALVYNNGSDIRMDILTTSDNLEAGVGNIEIGTIGDDNMSETALGFGSGVFAGLGNDVVNVTQIADGSETFDAGGGTDTLTLSAHSDDNVIDLMTGVRYRTIDTSAVDIVINFENASAASGNDAIYGTDGANILTGLDGNDVLWGRAGADTLVGGNGDDVYLIDDAGDSVSELALQGIDTVYTEISGGYTLADNVEIGVDITTGTAGITLIGNIIDNVLILTNTAATTSSTVQGGGGNDTIYVQTLTTVDAGSGNDTIVFNGTNNTAQGGTGDDTYIITALGNNATEFSGQGNDTVYSYNSIFTLGDNLESLVLISFDANFHQNGTGNAAANTIIGSGSNNNIKGMAGNDFLIGGGGDDTLTGGEGLDVMQGHSGQDNFLYNNFAELGDIIQDWVSMDDSFYFDALAFGFGSGTSLIDGVNFISSTGPSSIAAQATFLWDSDDYDLYYDGDGTGTGVSAVLVASLQDFTTVDVTDFIFF